jgi:hypothetical protein
MLGPLLLISISTILMGNSQLQKDGILLKNYSAQSIIKNNLDQNAEINMQNIILLPNNEFDQMEAAEIINRVNKLPLTLLEKLELKGVKVKLFSGKLTDNPTAKKLAGIIPRGYKSQTTWDSVPGIGGGQTVLVKIGASQRGNGHGSVNLEFHELAHTIDYKVLGHYSKIKEYILIWNKEKHHLFPLNYYFLNYPEEYFAETFAMYYMGGKDKEKLSTNAPLTYQYITSIK